ncbi:MAG: tol-pal system beta propeller repeat protein TolB [bacterium]|jgi:tol-pal system beta propeller repeat protein TolB
MKLKFLQNKLTILFILSLYFTSPAFAIIKSDIIDIRGAIYGRLELALLQGKGFDPSRDAIHQKVDSLLRKNLVWSGLFNIHKNFETADLLLHLTKKNTHQIQARVTTSENLQLFSDILFIPKNPLQLEDRILEFIERLTKQLTGKKGVLGTAIIFSEQSTSFRKNLVVVDTHGKKKRVVVKDENINILPRWTPLGDGVVYTSAGERGSWVLEYNFLKKKSKVIAAYRGISSGGTWGPSKKKLIITISHQGNPDLFLIRNDGKILRKLTRRSSIDTSPSWSPDGKSVLYVSNRSGSAQIYQMNIKTRRSFRMTFSGRYNTEPRWSKDGSHILYTGRVKGVLQVFLMDKYGDHLRQLTHGKISSEQPDWSPDGRQIIYTYPVNGDQKIFIMTADGLYRRRLTNSGKGIKEMNSTWTGNFNWSKK